MGSSKIENLLFKFCDWSVFSELPPEIYVFISQAECQRGQRRDKKGVGKEENRRRKRGRERGRKKPE